MQMIILDAAKAEFVDIIAYYNNESEGLGYRFAVEVKRTFARILQYPQAWPPFPSKPDGVV